MGVFAKGTKVCHIESKLPIEEGLDSARDAPQHELLQSNLSNTHTSCAYMKNRPKAGRCEILHDTKLFIRVCVLGLNAFILLPPSQNKCSRENPCPTFDRSFYLKNL